MTNREKRDAEAKKRYPLRGTFEEDFQAVSLQAAFCHGAIYGAHESNKAVISLEIILEEILRLNKKELFLLPDTIEFAEKAFEKAKIALAD